MVLKDIQWHSVIASQGIQDTPTGKILLISGPALDGTINLNNWQVPTEEFESIAKQLDEVQPQLRADHSESIYHVIGRVKKGFVKDNLPYFEAEVGDEAVIPKILKGYVTHVSIGADADEITCSVCNQPTLPIKACKCENSHEVIRKIKLKELSLVANPAYTGAKFTPMGFVASLTKKLDELRGVSIQSNAQMDKQEPLKPLVVINVSPSPSELTTTQSGESKMAAEIKPAAVETPIENKTAEPATPVVSKPIKAEEDEDEERKKEEKTQLRPSGPEAVNVLQKMEEMAKKLEERLVRIESLVEGVPVSGPETYSQSGHRKTEEDEDEDEEPRKKKEEEAYEKKRKSEEDDDEEDDDEDDEEEERPMRKKSRKRDDDDDEEVGKMTHGRARKREDDDEEEEKKKEEDEEDDEDEKKREAKAKPKTTVVEPSVPISGTTVTPDLFQAAWKDVVKARDKADQR